MFNFSINQKPRISSKHKRTIREVNKLAESMQDWSNKQLQEQGKKLQIQIRNGATLEKILPEAFATVKQACLRVLGIQLFDVQILGGIILHYGQIAEMKTGEGKTIVATLPAYLNSLERRGVHIVTVNDYLAKRDTEWIGAIYNFLGLKVGLIQQNMSNEERKKNYMTDVTYVTNSELGFDYLKDNMAISKSNLVQSGFNFCIIDEVDSILIDEARTPLIISGPSQAPIDKYKTANLIAQSLQTSSHYEIDEKAKNITLTDTGIIECENKLQVESIYSTDNPWAQYILNALKAKKLFKENQDYIVRDQEIVIVDEFTGRIMPGRRWSDGLHQAIEAKENVHIQGENQTLASITYQNFFLLYPKLAGMTGTAKTEAQELYKIYATEVIEVPTNMPSRRKDLSDLVYKQEYDKWMAVANECYDMYRLGRPTLIGTTNVEKSELLATLLKTCKVPYNLLNAKPENVTKESDIIAQAGRISAITIATNMAGRGTDIILGGNAEQITKFIISDYIKTNHINPLQTHDKAKDEIIMQALQKLHRVVDMNPKLSSESQESIKQCIDKSMLIDTNHDRSNSIIKEVHDTILTIYKKIFAEDKAKIVKLGGLHVIGTERHESRRIDNQLRGRAGRQGDPGTSRFFLSLEDNLFRIFGGEKIYRVMETLNMSDDTPIESKILSSSLNNAQKKVEQYYYDARKQLFKYDEVLNSQRQATYAERNRVLHSSYIRDCIIEYGETTINDLINSYAEEGDRNRLKTIICKIVDLLNLPEGTGKQLIENINTDETEFLLCEHLRTTYDLREAYLEQLKPGLSRKLEKYYILQQIDNTWQEHLEKMATLRESIGWRSYGQQDPLMEYKSEAFNLFLDMNKNAREKVLYLILRSKIITGYNGLK